MFMLLYTNMFMGLSLDDSVLILHASVTGTALCLRRSVKIASLEVSVGDVLVIAAADDEEEDGIEPPLGLLQAMWQTAKGASLIACSCCCHIGTVLCSAKMHARHNTSAILAGETVQMHKHVGVHGQQASNTQTTDRHCAMQSHTNQVQVQVTRRCRLGWWHVAVKLCLVMLLQTLSFS